MKLTDLIVMLEKATEEEKTQIRGLLGIVLKDVKTSVGTRVSGKVQRTEKILEGKIAKQMEILIKVLPVDKAVDINEWGELALAGGLQTQQPAARIAAYYKKPIVDGGYATIVN